MARIINTEGSGKERNKLIRAVVIALRELLQTQEKEQKYKDLAAFIALSLNGIYCTVDNSVTAWEKRGYWVKADRFRMEWEWCNTLGKQFTKAVLSEDWDTMQELAIKVAVKFGDVHIPVRHRLGTPWDGALEQLKSMK